MSELPEGWAECEIGDVATVAGGGTPDSHDPQNFSTDNGIAWVTPADLGGYQQIYISRGQRFLTEKGLKQSSAKLLPRGTVLFSSRAPIGYVAIAANEISTNQGFKSFVCKDGVSSQYLYYWLRFATPLAEELASGTTFPEISGKNAARIPLRLAPVDEQLRIAAKLEKLLSSVDATQARLANIPRILKRFRQSVLAAACSGKLTADWREKNGIRQEYEPAIVEDVTDYVGGFAYRSPTFTKSGANQVIRIGNVRPFSLKLDASPVFIPDEIGKATERFQLARDDIVISMTGTKYKKDYGNAAIVTRTDHRLFLNQRVSRLRCSKKVLPLFMLYWFQTDTFRDFFFEGETGNVNQGNIGADGIRKAPIDLPSLPEQQEIVRRVEALFKNADVLEARYRTAKAHVDKLTQSILAKAFRGELVPQDPNDEPASVLLERVRLSKNGSSDKRQRIKAVSLLRRHGVPKKFSD
jgi:type I restriction enzyme S subunit